MDVSYLFDKALAEVDINIPQTEVDRDYDVVSSLHRDFRGIFTEALSNLITNALEAMPNEGKLTLTTQVHYCDGQQYAVLEVQDTGNGIPDSEKDLCGT